MRDGGEFPDDAGGIRGGGDLRHVGADGEGFARTREDDDPGGRIVDGADQGREGPFRQVEVEGIVNLRPVEDDPGDRAAGFRQDDFLRHALFPPFDDRSG
jgi:hypothetical protein